MPLAQLESMLPSLDRSKTYVLYCASAFRSGIATSLFRKAGLNAVDFRVGYVPVMLPWLKSHGVFDAESTTALAAASAPDVRQLTCTEAKSLLEGATPPLVLDLRDADDFASKHIRGSVNIPVSDNGKFTTWVSVFPSLLVCPCDALIQFKCNIVQVVALGPGVSRSAISFLPNNASCLSSHTDSRQRQLCDLRKWDWMILSACCLTIWSPVCPRKCTPV